MRPVVTTACLLAIALPVGALAQSDLLPHTRSGRDSAAVAGWYDIAGGGRVLVVWGPTAGYRLLDFDAARFHRLTRRPDSTYTVAGTGAWADAIVAFDRDARGVAVAFTLTPPRAPPVRATASRTYPFDVEEARYGSGSVELAGLVLIPRVRKLVGKSGSPLRDVPMEVPAAVFLHGSGDSDRDNVWAFTIAQHVARAGFVTLLPDKRGSGASRGDWRTAGLDDLAGDALSAVEFLRRDPRVDPARIGLVGLSQGGVIAPLAAARAPDVAYVVSVSGAPVTLFEQMRHEMEQDLQRAGVPEPGIAAITAVGALAVSYARSESDSAWSRYDSALGALRAGPFAAAAAAFPAARTDWHWAWWAKVGDVDPLPSWASLTRPRLALFGEDDERDNVPVRESVRLLNEALRPERDPRNVVRVYPGIGHALVDTAEGWVSRRVLSDLSDWMLRSVGGLDRPVPSRQ